MMFSYLFIKTHCGYSLEVPSAETLLLSTHNVCFLDEIRKYQYCWLELRYPQCMCSERSKKIFLLCT